MLGVVLAGGQSSRMGRDKGLIRLAAANWAQIAVEKLAVLGLPVVVSVNSTQYDAYAAVFPAEQLVKDDERLGIKGPLLGVWTVHEAHPQEDLLVLACDMPLMETTVLSQLLASWPTEKKDASVFNNHGQPEPLCAIYSADGLQRVLQQHRGQSLPRFSMQYLLQQLDVQYLPVQPEQERAFRNFNEQQEMKGL